MHMFIHANAFVGDGFRFLGLDLITLNYTCMVLWGFWKEGMKEGGMNICFVNIVFLV